MAEEVYMDIPEVENIAKKFDEISDVLDTVAKVLDALANLLKSTAFIGLVGGAVLLMVIEFLKPRIEEMAKKCAEISRDVTASVRAYERGDAQGATRFY